MTKDWHTYVTLAGEQAKGYGEELDRESTSDDDDDQNI
jgi:hypothetical protein